MSEFVNYNKRDISLPKGCKDLADVLQGKGEGKPNLPGNHEESLGRLAELDEWAARAFESHAKMLQLQVWTSEQAATLMLHRRGRKTGASVTVRGGSSTEEKVKAVFERKGLATPQGSPLPKTLFFPESSTTYDLTPFSKDAASFSALAKDLLKNVCGLEDESPVWFRYMELEILEAGYDPLVTQLSAEPLVELLNHFNASGGLEQLEGMLGKFFGSTAENCALRITSGNDISLVLERTKDGAIGSLIFIHSAEREREMREILTRYGLDEPPPATSGPVPFLLFPQAPVHGTYDLKPLPSNQAQCKLLMEEIFRSLMGTADVLLMYLFREYRRK
jgi:hypothetical protein